jgi:DNA-binding NarL/FixJ family response regulator
VHVLLAADAQWLVDDIVAALGDENTSFTVCSEGREVARQLVKARKELRSFDVGIFDLQIGSMGGMAVTMAMRLDASAGTAPEVPALMLLDRAADVHLAKRSGADGWLIKPLDPLRIRRAVRTVAAGGTYKEGYVEPGSVFAEFEPAPPPAVDAPGQADEPSDDLAATSSEA